jgi:hypothetical protein
MAAEEASMKLHRRRRWIIELKASKWEGVVQNGSE